MGDSAGVVGWGFLGAGGVAKRQMLPAVVDHPEVRVAGVMVRDLGRAQELAATFGAAAAYDNYTELVNDPGVEAVYIATPPATHEVQVLTAIAAGKAVLLEKPMATTPDAARRMCDAAAKAGVLLAVCFPMRHTGANRALRQRIQDGALGQLVLLRAQMAKWYPLDESVWRADPEQAGGGVIMDLGSHLLDWVYYLSGEAVSISAMTAQRVWPVAVEDTAVLHLELTNGALASLELGFGVAGSHTALEVYGTHAVARQQGGKLRLETPDGVEEPALAGTNVYREELLDFGRALKAGRSAVTCGEDGYRNVAQLTAAYRAAAQGSREVLAVGSSAGWL